MRRLRTPQAVRIRRAGVMPRWAKPLISGARHNGESGSPIDAAGTLRVSRLAVESHAYPGQDGLRRGIRWTNTGEQRPQQTLFGPLENCVRGLHREALPPVFRMDGVPKPVAIFAAELDSSEPDAKPVRSQGESPVAVAVSLMMLNGGGQPIPSLMSRRLVRHPESRCLKCSLVLTARYREDQPTAHRIVALQLRVADRRFRSWCGRIHIAWPGVIPSRS